MKPKMEQRITRNIYDELIPVYDVTDSNGKVETFRNYDDAYRWFLHLTDKEVG